MLKARLLVGAVIAVVALGATTSMVSAAVKHVPPKAKPAAVAAATLDSGPPASLHCGKGQTPELRTMGKMRWVCVKAG
jgi:tetrahydromethanopterin S-methyltransferase subunit D